MSSWNRSTSIKKCILPNLISHIPDYLTNTGSFITFIIPTINRPSLIFTLTSLLNQTKKEWKAIVLFDGCVPTNSSLLQILKDERFLWISIEKTGTTENAHHGTAGNVRNRGLSLVTTSWVGFVDDDDRLTSNYVEILLKESSSTPTADIVVFRMVDKNTIIPPIEMNRIVKDHVGISFACKYSLIQDGFVFKQSETEDYTFLNNAEIAGKRIVLSPHITYMVRDSIYINNSIAKRSIIN